jgi:RimJ/RimL family protein N-acetyltransferase
MGRMSLDAPLASDDVVVRELTAEDAVSVADAASVVAGVRGSLPVPDSPTSAAALIARYEQWRRVGEGNLFGVFPAGSTQLVGVVSLRLRDAEEFVAEGAVWNRPDEPSRHAAAHGVALVVQQAHSAMGIRRVWVTLDPLDRLTKSLAWEATFSAEEQVREADGTLRTRYSSLG